MEQYFLRFQNSKKRYWWNIFTRPLFEHVDFITYNIETKIITVIAADLNGVNFHSYKIDKDIYEILQYNANSDNIIIETVKDDKIAQRIIIASCVGISKRFLGIKNRFIFTPYQLYNYLRKNRKILWQSQQQ